MAELAGRVITAALVVVPGELILTGAYEIIGPGHHFVMWAYRGERTATVADQFAGHHVGVMLTGRVSAA